MNKNTLVASVRDEKFILHVTRMRDIKILFNFTHGQCESETIEM